MRSYAAGVYRSWVLLRLGMELRLYLGMRSSSAPNALTAARLVKLNRSKFIAFRVQAHSYATAHYRSL